jgi:valyl-tRNA synthetase
VAEAFVQLADKGECLMHYEVPWVAHYSASGATLDDGLSEAVAEAFLQLADKGE